MTKPNAQPTEGTVSHYSTVPNASFIETQFPVSQLSKESYKERKANHSQTLTGLGKWWGRKPLIMVRAIILGLLMPASNDARRDRNAFLTLLTMDDEGLWQRKRKTIPLKEIYRWLSPRERVDWFAPATNPDRPKLQRGTTTKEKQRLQRIVFERMSYDERLAWCNRPEHVDGPSPESWNAINEHLATTATSLDELVRELGERRFGRVPRVGDAFCGGGSVPFEAARLGCEAYGSDLNPVAALLTWGALNVVGSGEQVAERVRQALTDVFQQVDQQIIEWRIEHNEAGWRADSFLYCTETTCPECNWKVPLSPNWVVGERTRTVARLSAIPDQKRFAIEICSGVDEDTLNVARNAGTVKESRLDCPNPECRQSTSMAAIRGDGRDGTHGMSRLRLWEKKDLVPYPDDVFQERLFCVRWRLPPLNDLLWAEQKARRTENAEPLPDKKSTPRTSSQVLAPVPAWVDLTRAFEFIIKLLGADDQRQLSELRKRDWVAEDHALLRAQQHLKELKDAHAPRKDISAAKLQFREQRVAQLSRENQLKSLAKSLPAALYRAVDQDDLQREQHTLALLQEHLKPWQDLGYVPSRAIAPGYNTDQIVRERGWTHWHHVFTPRQLLELGSMMCKAFEIQSSLSTKLQVILWIAKCAERNARIQGWDPSATVEKASHVFTNQALNTQYVVGVNAHDAMRKVPFVKMAFESREEGHVEPCDARSVQHFCDVWITDPPYADAVNYHELSGFFLSWYEKHIHFLFPNWYTDSKEALAVKGSGRDFRRSMVDCYRNLTKQMPEHGFQVVMFTHQDASVWADLTLILWAAGLRVTAAWTVATETESAYKEGNYVQGTVLMVLRKQTSEETVFLYELVPDVETEVERQLESMLALDDRDYRNFSDADYQLAAYAAALRVLTKFASIEDIDIARELARERKPGDANPIEMVIEDAVRTASSYLVPAGLPDHLWRRLGAEERFYLKGLEVESHGDYRSGVYQEYARGFGVRDYRFMLRSRKANETRLKTGSEFQRRGLDDSAFGQSLVRHALYAVWRAAQSGEVAPSLTWLRTELPDYWPRREALAVVLRYLGAIDIAHWSADAEAAVLVAGAVENDHV